MHNDVRKKSRGIIGLEIGVEYHLSSLFLSILRRGCRWRSVGGSVGDGSRGYLCNFVLSSTYGPDKIGTRDSIYRQKIRM